MRRGASSRIPGQEERARPLSTHRWLLRHRFHKKKKQAARFAETWLVHTSSTRRAKIRSTVKLRVFVLEDIPL